MKNIYLSNLDTPLGYHIAQFFRKDHLQVEPSLRIIGTTSSPLEYPWIHATVDVQFGWISSKKTHS